MRQQLQQKRYTHYINIRRQKHQEVIKAKRFLNMEEPAKTSSQLNYQLLFSSVEEHNTALILEGLSHIAGSLNHFNEAIAKSIICDNIPELLLHICDSDYIRLLNSQHQVFIKTRCIYILSRLSHLRQFRQHPQLVRTAITIIQNLQKSNPLRLKHMLIFLANTIECEAIFQLVISHQLVHSILDLLDLHDKWAFQMESVMIWFFRSVLEAIDRHRYGTTESECRRMLNICLSIVNRLSQYEQDIERQDTLLDSLVIINHIQRFCQDEMVTFEFSKTAFIQILRSKQLPKKHIEQCLVVLEHICRTSEEHALQLCSSIFFLPSIVENLLHCPEICLRILSNISAVPQCHRFLKDICVLVGLQLETNNSPQFNPLYYEYIFNYFEANGYSLEHDEEKELLSRIVGCQHHAADLESELQFWFRILLRNGPVQVPEYLFSLLLESDRLNYILENGLKKQ